MVAGVPLYSLLDTEHGFPSLQGIRLGGGSVAEQYAEEEIKDEEFPVVEYPDLSVYSGEGQIVLPNSGDVGRAIAQMTWKSDKTMLSDVRFSGSTSNGVLSFFLRSSGDWYDAIMPTQGYELQMDTNGNAALFRIENAVRTLLASESDSATFLNQRVRFETNGTYIRFRRWLESESEPGTWNLEVNDTGGFTTAGGFQISFRNDGGDHNVYLDNISVDAP